MGGRFGARVNTSATLAVQTAQPCLPLSDARDQMERASPRYRKPGNLSEIKSGGLSGSREALV